MGDSESEAVDPRVKDQLEYLNSYTDEINSLELQLDEANATFRNTLSEYSQILKQLGKKLGKCVHTARPYFEAEEACQKAKLECEDAAIRYHKACSIHKEARETIALTEGKFNDNKDEYEFNSAWQEMLNRETTKLINAEALKEKSEKEHQRTTHIFADAQKNVKLLEQRLKKDIAKARIYFEQKKVFLKVLQDLKGRVESLQKAVMDSKASYANCLHNLEMISKEIHDRRKLCLPPREPGVGAEGEVPIQSDISIYPPLADIHLTDTESELTDSLSSLVESELPDDLKDICANAFVSIPGHPAKAISEIKSKQRTKSDPCLPPNGQTDKTEELDIVSCANAHLSEDLSPSSSLNKELKVLSRSSESVTCNPNVFEEVDLNCD